MSLNKNLKTKCSTLILIISWLLSCSMITILISTILTMNYSLNIPVKQIETIEELSRTDMSMVLWPTFIALHTISKHNVLDKIYKRALSEETIVPLSDLLSNPKWITDTSQRRNAIFLYPIPLKALIVKNLKNFDTKTKFRYLGERWALPYILSIATTMRFSKKLRSKINFR